ncbi:hypothetical protein OJJOAM_004404 [Cupriavidus sp. H18C1]|uniref:HpcH/HpaI aldolase/citrate lyase family protein n=1 Tax=Cupriavidus sp. H18C1 TaxID=3241601 RepID=UPI003BB91F03
MTDDFLRLRRSVLYVPPANARAIDKAAALPCDAIVFDLEDAVSPAMKGAARAQLAQALSAGRPANQEIVLRVDALGTAEFEQDLMLAASARVDAVLLPKVGDDSDVVAFAGACAALAWDKLPTLWAMVETPQAIHRLDAIVAAGHAATPRLDCLVIGTNDLAKDTGVFAGEERRYLLPWLMLAVLAAKRYGVDILDGVWNDFGDQAGYAAELTQSVRLAFDGKTLIHPSQIDAANAAFAPSAQQVAEAERIAAAFAAGEQADAGVINLDGRMVERLHLEQALPARRIPYSPGPPACAPASTRSIAVSPASRRFRRPAVAAARARTARADRRRGSPIFTMPASTACLPLPGGRAAGRMCDGIWYARYAASDRRPRRAALSGPTPGASCRKPGVPHHVWCACLYVVGTYSALFEHRPPLRDAVNKALDFCMRFLFAQHESRCL